MVAVSRPRLASALLMPVLLWEFGILLLKARGRLFWYDELLTFHLSALQPFSLLWRALQAGADGMPPGFYALVRLARWIPGDPHVTLRLPSILGYLLTLIGIYWFGCKRLPPSAALAAVLLVTLSPFRSYAVEARSYALVVGFLAIAAALWQRIEERRFLTPLLALALALAVSCHPLVVVALSCFGAAEIAWTLRSRRFRWGVWVAYGFAAAPFLWGLPVLLHYREVFGKNHWAPPMWSTAFTTYENYLGLDFRLALVPVAWFGILAGGSLWRWLRNNESASGPREDGFSPPEMFLVGGFLYYPILVVMVSKVLRSGYTPRYGWPAVLGLVLGSVYLLRILWRESSDALLGALLVPFVVQGVLDFGTVHLAGFPGVDGRWARLADVSRSVPGIPVVVGSGMKYLEAARYAPPDLRDRLVEVVDVDQAIRLVGTDSLDKTNRILAQFVPLRVEDLGPFEARYQRFLLSSSPSYDWFTRYLLESKYRLTLLSTDAGTTVYLVER